MTDDERERISELGRLRGEELLAAGILERKSAALRALGWPDAVRRVREERAAS